MDRSTGPAFAQVAVLAHLGRAGGLFTYGLPAEIAVRVTPGSLVAVPFASRTLQGVVYGLESTCALPTVRDITDILDPEPVVTRHQLRLAEWICGYYAAPISDVLGAMVPPGIARKSVFVLKPGPVITGLRLNDAQRRVLACVLKAGEITLDDIKSSIREVDVERAVASLARRNALSKSSELNPPRVRIRRERIVSVSSDGRVALTDASVFRRAPQQLNVLTHIAERGPVTTSAITHALPTSKTVITTLERKGFVHIAEQDANRVSVADRRRVAPTESQELSPAQRTALRAITSSVFRARPDVYLLHGVTGSGKTEVYLQAIAAAVGRGRQAIMMVPEISLTPQAIERVAGRFPRRVAVLHSKLSNAERMDEWQRIRLGQVDVVVGPRSALFAPLRNPGIIIVDEEHDPSYKQDASPRYNGRDAAAVLGRLACATVVFGSATPDVGTYHAARTGRIRLLELPDRPVWSVESQPPFAHGHASPTSRPMPPVEVIDMRQELKLGNRGMFSNALLDALESTLTNGHQSLLFLNRRGSATVVLCRDCGFVVRCHSCDIPFTYHSAASRLMCHRCDRRASSPRLCPSCESPRIRYLGIGTQRVEEEVRRLFPRARVLRWDRDVTGGKGAHDRILGTFASHQADILVGTQMIAKGLDFPLVTLVGVISADTGLHMPDFRAPERSFQLLTQVAGRAGRAHLPSRVVVQTYTPEHYAIRAAKDHDYARFYREEMSFRRSAWYPPFARLIRLVYSSETEDQCRQSANNLRAILTTAIGHEKLTDVETIGPAPCFQARIQNRYYWQIITRCRGNDNAALQRLLDYVPAGWTIDVDPVDLL
ncbi:MAG: primosomal protein N' [Chloroflexota bacterium]|nr:MAG: primosomal protein N' [Chloroflexota bacterium]